MGGLAAQGEDMTRDPWEEVVARAIEQANQLVGTIPESLWRQLASYRPYESAGFTSLLEGLSTAQGQLTDLRPYLGDLLKQTENWREQCGALLSTEVLTNLARISVDGGGAFNLVKQLQRETAAFAEALPLAGALEAYGGMDRGLHDQLSELRRQMEAENKRLADALEAFGGVGRQLDEQMPRWAASSEEGAGERGVTTAASSWAFMPPPPLPIQSGLEDVRAELATLREEVACLRLIEAWRSWGEGKPELAEIEARAALSHLPETAEAWLVLGLSLNAQKKHPEACASFQRAEALAPQLFVDRPEFRAAYEAALQGRCWDRTPSDSQTES